MNKIRLINTFSYTHIIYTNLFSIPTFNLARTTLFKYTILFTIFSSF